MDTKTLDAIRTLRDGASAFASFHTDYRAKYASDSRCDKKGYGFGMDNRFAGFPLKTHFASWSGYYGNSGCGTIFRIRDEDLAQRFMVQALNEHQELIFATVARLMREEAASLAGKAAAEIETLQKMLSDVSAESKLASNERPGGTSNSPLPIEQQP